ncbi:hypothetical protein [Streptomyces acidiscabies]|uniref:hypothetical protein n=1 Tax=Streptomyces acidiscabies TaxID=42234 RepID=UPI0009638303|nr:hypothetical protein [Streptomyces acidiscabies]GAV42166.1 hypothetical protein Saa2_05088 [Streptomyces acidiscabies]
MVTRSGDNYPAVQGELLASARETEGEHRGIGRCPVVDAAEAWELRSMLEVTAPGVELACATREFTRTACLVHPDGSWARAEGSLPLLGAALRITSDGVCRLSRGRWQAPLGDVR